MANAVAHSASRSSQCGLNSHWWLSPPRFWFCYLKALPFIFIVWSCLDYSKWCKAGHLNGEGVRWFGRCQQWGGIWMPPRGSWLSASLLLLPCYLGRLQPAPKLPPKLTRRTTSLDAHNNEFVDSLCSLPLSRRLRPAVGGEVMWGRSGSVGMSISHCVIT